MIKLLQSFYFNCFRESESRLLCSRQPAARRCARDSLGLSLGISNLACSLEHEVRHRSSCEGLGISLLALQLHSRLMASAEHVSEHEVNMGNAEEDSRCDASIMNTMIMREVKI